ncbi:glycosyltransferase [Croceicoccus estronivorus]|uniref:glycosyltransferase n=1 Tax=Croceicoccus estronivorus TaxID=1172626 RepID=UPI001478155B|nr:glycosyltransferase [Croceicoccus estronivorus]
MKILFLTSTLPRFPGDMQANFVAEQAEAWLAARPFDEITVLAPHDSGAPRKERHGNLCIERFPYMLRERWQRLAYPAILPNIRRNPALVLQVPFFLWGEYRAASQVVRGFNPHLIYAHWVMPQGVVAWQLKRKLGIPYILQNHSSDLSAFLKLGGFGRKIAKDVLKSAEHFFCVNAYQRDFALDFFDDDVQRAEFSKRCTVLPMGIGGNFFSSTKKEKNGFEIATIARLSRKKGLNYLLEAAERLADRGVMPSIGIAGDGEDRAELQAMVSKANVTFTGFLNGREKEHFLASAQRFIFPARSSDGDVEGMPVALLEALCRGCPVLASKDTNIELLPEWPSICETVALVPDPTNIEALEKAIERLLGADQEKSREAAKLMSRYRWDCLIQEYLSVIEKVA